MGAQAFTTPNQGEDGSFCCWIAEQRLAQKEVFISQTAVSAFCSSLQRAGDLAMGLRAGDVDTVHEGKRLAECLVLSEISNSMKPCTLFYMRQ